MDEADGDEEASTFFSSGFSSLPLLDGATPGQRESRVEGSLKTTVLDRFLLDRPAIEDDGEAVVDSEEGIGPTGRGDVRTKGATAKSRSCL